MVEVVSVSIIRIPRALHFSLPLGRLYPGTFSLSNLDNSFRVVAVFGSPNVGDF
jgi:hypothetical protein